jgi:hypothetical protein
MGENVMRILTDSELEAVAGGFSQLAFIGNLIAVGEICAGRCNPEKAERL